MIKTISILLNIFLVWNLIHFTPWVSEPAAVDKMLDAYERGYGVRPEAVTFGPSPRIYAHKVTDLKTAGYLTHEIFYHVIFDIHHDN